MAKRERKGAEPPAKALSRPEETAAAARPVEKVAVEALRTFSYSDMLN
jgi:hypothetical protein